MVNNDTLYQCIFPQALDKQKRKVEEEKSAQASLKRENQSLIESCDELERKRQKIEHDLQTKEAHISCLEGQLSSAKNSADAESNKVCPCVLNTYVIIATEATTTN